MNPIVPYLLRLGVGRRRFVAGFGGSMALSTTLVNARSNPWVMRSTAPISKIPAGTVTHIVVGSTLMLDILAGRGVAPRLCRQPNRYARCGACSHAPGAGRKMDCCHLRAQQDCACQCHDALISPESYARWP
jgi:hypothetical protein